MARRRIPVVLLAGFLGAGKTTVLNHLLRHNGGVRIGVVVNDFGAINIDSMMVAGQVDSMVSLGNGCICCAVDVDDMDAMFETLTRRGSAIDVIVVEASGLAEPRNMVRLVLGSQNENIVYGGLVAVVDAAEFSQTRSRHPEIDGHLGIADLVLVNKSDRVTPEQRTTVVDAVRNVVGSTPLVPIAHGRVDPQLLFDRRGDEVDSAVPRQLSLDEMLTGSGDHGHDHDHGTGDDHREHIHAAYSHVAFADEQPFDPRRLVAFLENPPSDLYRVKGFVRFDLPGYTGKYLVQTVGRHITFEKQRWSTGEKRTSSLVMIGVDIDRGALLGSVRGCLRVPDRDGRDPSGMLPVHRYTVQNK